MLRLFFFFALMLSAWAPLWAAETGTPSVVAPADPPAAATPAGPPASPVPVATPAAPGATPAPISPASAPSPAATAPDSVEVAPAVPTSDAASETADSVEYASDEDLAAAGGLTPTGPVNFKGTLKARGTRRLLSSLTVYLKGTPYEATSDAKGAFAFKGLPAGTYQVVVPSPDFEPFKTKEDITLDTVTTVTYYLEPKIYSTMEVVVRGQKEKKEVSKKVMRIEEAKAIPGALNDAVRVVENLPGVARGSTSAAGLVIRGSNAEDSNVLLDGHQLPMLFHFGGMKSVYNSDLLSEINLYTGGFGTQFTPVTGGVVELKSRNPRSDRWGGYIDTSFIDATALAEGPITSDMGVALAVRRSTIDLILPAVVSGQKDFSFTAYPVYYDYQGKYTYKINRENSLTVDAYGLYDNFQMLSKKVSDDEPEFSGGLGYKVQAHSAVVHYRFKNDLIDNDFSPANILLDADFKIGSKYYLDTVINRVDVNDDLRLKLHPNHTLCVGFQLMPGYYTIKTNVIRPPKEGDVSISLSNSATLYTKQGISEVHGGFYLNDEMVFGPVSVIPGVRADFESYLNIYAISPSLLTRYHVIEPLTLKASVGLYHKMPEADEMLKPFGNRGLDYERALHIIGGAEWDITKVLSLDVQGYYKYLTHQVNAISKAKTSDTSDSSSDKVYDNSAKGRVYGAEVLLRYAYTDAFFGWISYSFSRSERNDGPGTSYRLFDMDQTHNLTVVASWQFAKTWRVGGRFRLTSGEPYTDILGGLFNADTGTYLPIYDPTHKNSKRGELFHQLDLRLDKQWVFNTWILNAYLDVQNAYYHANAIGMAYNYDFSEHGYYRYLPILPSIGIKAEF